MYNDNDNDQEANLNETDTDRLVCKKVGTQKGKVKEIDVQSRRPVQCDVIRFIHENGSRPSVGT